MDPEETMASTAGFEPATPGFIPLRLSPPPSGVRGLDCPFAMDRKGLQALPVQSLHLPAELVLPQAWLGIGMLRKAVKLSPNLSRSVAPFPCATPNSVTRNPVLYPTELRGHHRASSLPRGRRTIKPLRRHSCAARHNAAFYRPPAGAPAAQAVNADSASRTQ